jgi:Tol biopolymer transport system component
MRLQMVTPPGDIAGFALSPDGRTVVFAAEGKLWLRSLAVEDARPLEGTESAGAPFWSPDSQSIGFFQEQQLKRLDLAGGTPRKLADSPQAYGGSWSRDGVILFSRVNTAPLFRVAATGGTPVEATRLDSPRHVAHRFPHFLPDGRHFLVYVTGAPDVQGGAPGISRLPSHRTHTRIGLGRRLRTA